MLENLSKPSSKVIIGVNDLFHLLEGWHERAIDARSGVVYRASCHSASLQILKQPNQKQISFLISGAPYLLAKPIIVTVKCDSDIISRFSLTTENWVLRYAEIDSLPEGLLRLNIETNPIFIPHHYLGNGDYREMGVNLASAIAS